jgi:hypothetical protein
MLKTRLPYLLAIAVLLLALAFSVHQCQQNKQEAGTAAKNVQVLLADTERLKKNAEGQTVTYKQSLQLQADEFSKIKGVKDATIASLQKAVKDAGKRTTAATVFTATTKDRAAGAVDSIRYITRTEVRDSLPTYYGIVRGPGFEAAILANKDSIVLDSYEVTQRYTVAFTDREVQITPLSLNTVATDVQSFQLPPDPKPKRGLWALIGGVLVFILVSL